MTPEPIASARAGTRVSAVWMLRRPLIHFQSIIHVRQVSVRALRGVTPFAVSGATFPRAPPCTQWPVDLYCPKITQERGRTAVLSDDTGAIRADEAALGCGPSASHGLGSDTCAVETGGGSRRDHDAHHSSSSCIIAYLQKKIKGCLSSSFVSR